MTEKNSKQPSSDSADDFDFAFDFVPHGNDDVDVPFFLDAATTRLTKKKEMPFSEISDRQRRPPRLPASSSTCRALSMIIFAVLLSCALLSHYFTTNTATITTTITGITTGATEWLLSPPPPPHFATTDMIMAEKQALLKSYLGEGDASMNLGVKLPAGGNPIELIRLLHSSKILNSKADDEKENEHK